MCTAHSQRYGPGSCCPHARSRATVYSPLKQYGCQKNRKNKRRASGSGRFRYFALLLATLTSANVTAISHSNDKNSNAVNMGASNFISTADAQTKPLSPIGGDWIELFRTPVSRPLLLDSNSQLRTNLQIDRHATCRLSVFASTRWTLSYDQSPQIEHAAGTIGLCLPY